MEITCTTREETAHWPMFSAAGIAMTTATVEFDVPGDGITSMGFSHRQDDPDGMWLADYRFGPDGYPHFSHGLGDRSCLKQIAGPEIVAAILAWEG